MLATSVRLWGVLSAIGAASFAASGSASGSVPPMADKVPAGGLAYVGWVGRLHAPPAAGDSHLGKMLAEPEMQRFGIALRSAIIQAILDGGRSNAAEIAVPGGDPAPPAPPESKLPKDYGETLEAFGQLLIDRPTAVWLDSVTVNIQGAFPQMAAVTADPDGKAAAAFAKMVAPLVPENARKTDRIAGAEVTVFEPMPKLKFVWGTAGGHFFAAIGSKTAGRLIGVLSGDKDVAVLGADEEFARVFGKLKPATPVLAMYVDGVRLRQAIAGWAGDAAAMALEGGAAADVAARAAAATAASAVMAKLGVGEAAGLGCVVDFAGRQTRTAVFLRTTGPRKGLLALLDGAPLSEDQMAAVPADSNGFVSLNLDVPLLWETVVGTMGLIPGGPVADLERALGKFKTESKVDVVRDILNSVGPAVHLINVPRLCGDGFVEPLAVFEVRKPATLRRADRDLTAYLVKTLAPRGNADEEEEVGFDRRPRLHSQTVAGREVRYFTFGRFGGPFAPSWAVTERHLVLSLHPQPVMAMVRHLEGRRPGIATVEAYKAARAGVPAEAQLTAWADTPGYAPLVSGFALVFANLMAGSMDRSGFHLDPAALPSPDAWVPHLTPATETVTAGADGLLIESRSTLPLFADSPVVAGPVPATPGVWIAGVFMIFLRF